jgi:hypothetical protein
MLFDLKVTCSLAQGSQETSEGGEYACLHTDSQFARFVTRLLLFKIPVADDSIHRHPFLLKFRFIYL